MPVTTIDKDPTALTMTVVAEFGVPVRRLWDAYADPRQIEKFWGPPEWPATFTQHDMAPGGRSEYYMTGPDGTKSAGYWEFLSVDAPHGFEVRNGFAEPGGSNDDNMPSMRMVFDFEETSDGSRVTTTTIFNSVAEMEQLIEMGMHEGMQAAMGQIDDVVSDLASFAAERATAAQILSDTQVRVSRIIRGELAQVWDAHHDPSLLSRWMLGPDGWRMPVCETATSVGDQYRYEWEKDDGTERFGFTGEVLESYPPYREVTTEQMIGMDGPGTVNEMTLVPVADGTLLSMVITYPNAELRDTILATGMTDGMEVSYLRLEAQVLTPA